MTGNVVSSKVVLGLLAITFALLVAIVLSKPASAHFLGEDSVDCSPGSCSIKWEDNTRWDGSRRQGISEWNNLGKVNITRDGSFSVKDLDIGDYSNCNTTTIAF